MTDRYDVDESRRAVSYGPVPGSDRWVLSFSTSDGDRVDIELQERAMYDLWVEVRGVPWPQRHEDKDRSIRQLLHYATGSTEERIQKAIDVIVGGPAGGRP